MATLRATSLYASGSSGLRLAVALVTTPLLVRFLGIREYGVWAIANSVAALVALAELETSSALNYYLAGDNARKDWKTLNADAATSFVIITLLAGLATTGLLIACLGFRTKLFGATADSTEVSRVLIVLAAGLVFRLWKNWQCATEAALLRYDMQILIETPVTFAMQVGSVVAAMVWHSGLAVAVWQTLVGILGCLIHFIVIRAIWPCRAEPMPLFRRDRARSILAFGLAEWMTTAGTIIFCNADRLIIDRLLGTSAAGLYSAAITVVNKIVEIPASFMRILPPAVSAAAACNDYSRVRHLLNQANRLNAATSFMAACGVLFWAEPIALIMVSSQQASVVIACLRILALIYGLHSVSSVAGWFATGLGRPLFNAGWALLGSALMCILMIELGRRYGLTAAAWGNAGFLVNMVIMVQVSHILHLGAADILTRFGPSVSSILLCWIICSTPQYAHLPIAVQAILYVVVQAPLLIWIVGWDSIKDLRTTSLPWFLKKAPATQ